MLASGGTTSIHRDEHDHDRFNVSRPLLVEPLLSALNKERGERGWLDASGLPPEQAKQLAAEMASYRRDARKGGRLDHDSGGHDDGLSAAGSAFWLARELKGRLGGYTAARHPGMPAIPAGGWESGRRVLQTERGLLVTPTPSLIAPAPTPERDAQDAAVLAALTPTWERQERVAERAGLALPPALGSLHRLVAARRAERGPHLNTWRARP